MDKNIKINDRTTKGDASESAIIKFCEHVDPIEEYRAKHRKLYTIPFNSTNKWMLAIC